MTFSVGFQFAVFPLWSVKKMSPKVEVDVVPHHAVLHLVLLHAVLLRLAACPSTSAALLQVPAERSAKLLSMIHLRWGAISWAALM